MKLVCVAGTLTKPWHLVEDELCHLFSNPSIQGTKYTWEAVVARVYYLSVIADKASGEVEITVETPFPYLHSSMLATVSAVLVVFLYPTVPLLFFVISVCLVLVLFSLIPGIVILPRYLYGPTSNFFSIEQYRISKPIFIPLSGFIVGFVYVQGTDSLLIPSLILGCLLVALLLYGSTISLAALRRQTLLFIILTLTLLPLIISVGNIAFVNELAEGVTGIQFVIFVAVLMINTVAVMAVYVIICKILSDKSQHLPNNTVESVLLRITWGGLILGLNISSVVLLPAYLIGRGILSDRNVPLATLATEFSSAGVPAHHLFAWVVMVILVSPFLGVCLLWVFHLHRELQMRRQLSNAVELTEIDIDVPVHVLETDHMQAYAHTTLTGQDKIVITSGLRDQLEPGELQAVIEHEKYHLENRDPIRIVVGTISGLLFGGKNAIVVLFNFPGIEIQADRYAVEKVGTTPMVRALRRLERAKPSATVQPSSVAGPPFVSQYGQRYLDRVVWPPYYVLFGNIVSESAHPTIDDRIAFILDDTD